MHSKVGRGIGPLRGRDMGGEGIDLIGFVFALNFFHFGDRTQEWEISQGTKTSFLVLSLSFHW